MYTQYLQVNYVQYFNQNEFLPEVWKCWGTLWFDLISENMIILIWKLLELK